MTPSAAKKEQMECGGNSPCDKLQLLSPSRLVQKTHNHSIGGSKTWRGTKGEQLEPALRPGCMQYPTTGQGGPQGREGHRAELGHCSKGAEQGGELSAQTAAGKVSTMLASSHKALLLP